MIPWQIAAVLALVIVVERFVDYFKRTDCNDEIRAARYEARHDSMGTYREAYRLGWQHGEADGELARKNAADNNAADTHAVDNNAEDHDET